MDNPLSEAFSLWIPGGDAGMEVVDHYLAASDSLDRFLRQEISLSDYLDSLNDNQVNVEAYCEDVLSWLT